MHRLRGRYPGIGWVSILVLALLAACEDVPTGDDGLAEDGFPFNANVEVSSDLSQTYFNLRVENGTNSEQARLTYEVTLLQSGVVAGSATSSVGPFGPKERRSATIAFGRQTVFDCFRWALVTGDGRRRATNIIC